MTRSIFGKLLLSHLVIILVSMLTMGLLMSYLVRDHVIENKRRDLLAKGSAAVTIVTPLLTNGQKPSAALLDAMSDMAGGDIWIMDKTGQIIAGQPPARWKSRHLKNLAEFWNTADWQDGSGAQKILKPRRLREPAIIAALPLPAAGSGQQTALFLFSPVTGATRTALALEQLLLYSLGAGILAAVLIGLLMARSLTRPLADISRAAAAFAGGDYQSRTNAIKSDEIGQLGRTFNSMASELAQIEQNRREFLSDVSHELKTPVASIQALAETMLDGLAKKPEQRERYLASIVGETKRIGRLVGDLLDLSQLESGELTIVREKISLSELITVHCTKLMPFLEAKSLIITTELPETIPPVIADPDRLGQVLANLLTNAIRHADTGSIIAITAHPHQQQIALTVSNTGPGIPAEHLPHIWERFYRVEKSRSRGDGGTGLGLAITKKLVEAMGGTVNASSTPGEITAFTITLPAKQ
ncbi:HAMP domain-containing sensor histidine kinase [Sporomusa sp.]|jgi:signal transduction histidine kinase|uniref:sensor histidine kinase n=1 Tax=Sporomusa sp. TaxID=2078658 RepID=UPI002C7450EE|nr:HAMP domain-containing sensor histidine kinase [Sporomusa sp.]MDF2873876.1 rcsC 8 [Sporomusa sp.]HWR07490.1 HAMP domain-containing sensor histidine kinase [Sporomusa sp.]